MTRPYIDEVEEFQKRMGQKFASLPCICPDHDFRFELIREEVDELKEALDNKDVVEVADALTDILYVVFGMASACGMPIEALYKEVHANNITKFGGEKRDDGKQLKNPEWIPPNIAGVLLAAKMQTIDAEIENLKVDNPTFIASEYRKQRMAGYEPDDIDYDMCHVFR